jgi:hypothetical protein
MKRICKCGCGGEVPAANRFQFIQGHMKRDGSRQFSNSHKAKATDCARCSGPRHRGRCKGSDAPKPAAQPKANGTTAATASAPEGPVVAVRVGVRFLDSWWAALSLEQKAVAFSVHAQ